MSIVVPFVRPARDRRDIIAQATDVFGAVCERLGLSASAVRVGLYLISIFDRDAGASHVFGAEIGRAIGMAAPRVRCAIRELEAAGLVLRHSPHNLPWPIPHEIFWDRIIAIAARQLLQRPTPEFLRQHAEKLRREGTLEERFRLEAAGLQGATGGGRETIGRWLGDGWREGVGARGRASGV